MKELYEKAKRVRQHTKTCDEQAPEIQTMVALKGDKNQNDQLDGVVKRQTNKDRDDDLKAEGVP